MTRHQWSAGLVVAVLALVSGCDDTKGDPEPEVPQEFDLSFSAEDPDPRDCIFEYLDPGGAGLIQLYGVKLDVPEGEGPPNSLHIRYGASSIGGEILPFSPDSSVTVVEPTIDGGPWSLTVNIGEEADRVIGGGQNWEIEFSCGTIPTCCDETPRVDVTVNP